MRVLKSSTAFYKINTVDGEDQYIPITELEYAKLYEAQQTKKRLWNAGMNGVALAGGVAVGEAALSGAAVAAETAVVAAEGVALLPFIATGLLIAGACAGTYAIYKAVKD